jgi:hypothetical protein
VDKERNERRDPTLPHRDSPGRVFLSGFTNVIDIVFGPDGSLYVLEIAHNGLLSGDPTGALIRVDQDGRGYRQRGSRDADWSGDTGRQCLRLELRRVRRLRLNCGASVVSATSDR